MDTVSEPLASRKAAFDKRHWLKVAGWITVTGLLTFALSALRDALDKSHIVLAYLLVVLIGTAQLGRRAGVGLALLCFTAFNFFLLPPYHTLAVTDNRDWFVLLAFLLTSLVAAQLLYRAQSEAATAWLRTLEIDRLSTLGAETLSAGRADEAVAAIAHVIQSTLGLMRCEIFLAETDPVAFKLVGYGAADGEMPPTDAPTTRVFDYVVERSAIAVERIDATVHVITTEGAGVSDAMWTQRDARALAIPLKVRDRCVGIMRVTGTNRIHLEPQQRRFAQALAYYAALGVERVRLTAAAERTEALRAADKLKDSFVAAVSHDLRTPLTTIKGLAHEMSPLDERARIIEAEADRLNHFVGDVLDLSKLNAGEVHMNLEVNAIEDLIGAALAQVAGLPGARAIKVDLPGGDVIMGTFDFVHSLRCLVNLIENALKYSPAKSVVQIIVEQTEASVRLSVCDRGPGIAAAHLPRIFEPFVRVSPDKTSGAGLGLAIARRVTTAQGGALNYVSRAGGGSIFTFEVPLARTQPTTAS